jgi:hypothetical protein
MNAISPRELRSILARLEHTEARLAALELEAALAKLGRAVSEEAQRAATAPIR